MAEILKRSKPLAVNPLKASQPLGAALAFLGVWQMALAFVGLVLGRVLLKDSAPGALVGFLATAVVMSFTGASVTAGGAS